MIHFAYPNVAQGQFLGCGRYAVLPAEQTPPGYHLATLTEVTNPQAVYAAAQHLAPALRTMEATALVYERRDRVEHDYRGTRSTSRIFWRPFTVSGPCGLTTGALQETSGAPDASRISPGTPG